MPLCRGVDDRRFSVSRGRARRENRSAGERRRWLGAALRDVGGLGLSRGGRWNRSAGTSAALVFRVEELLVRQEPTLQFYNCLRLVQAGINFIINIWLINSNTSNPPYVSRV